jgi:hypothetical protein
MVQRLVAVVGAVLSASCASGGGGKGLLPAPNLERFTASPYQPERPFSAQSDGSLARTIFRSDRATPYRAEVRDLIVPPAKRITLVPEGIAIVDTHEGMGIATVEERRLDLAPGATFGVAQSQHTLVQNTGKEPLVLRVYVVTVP